MNCGTLYLVFIFAQVAICLVAGLLGLLLGWLLWGSLVDPLRTEVILLRNRALDVQKFNPKLIELQDKLEDSEKQVALLKARVHELEPYLIEAADMEDRLRECSTELGLLRRENGLHHPGSLAQQLPPLER